MFTTTFEKGGLEMKILFILFGLLFLFLFIFILLLRIEKRKQKKIIILSKNDIAYGLIKNIGIKN